MGQRHLLLSLLLACTLGVQAGELRLVTGDDYAPFTDRKLPGGGLLTQVVMAALAEQQQTATLDWRPWMRGFKMAQAAEYDGTFPYIRTPEREADFLYSEPLYRVQQHIFSRSDETYEPDQLSALPGKRLWSQRLRLVSPAPIAGMHVATSVPPFQGQFGLFSVA